MQKFDKKFIIVIIILFIIICISIYFFTKDDTEDIISTNDFYISTNSTEDTEEISEIVVHIDGEILNPGIVHLPTGSRISYAINAAGGTTALADTSKINLAYVLKDGQKIYVPSVYDEEIVVYVTDDAGKDVVVPDVGGTTSLININSATASELETLPGIGASTAQKIINHRETNGKFKSIEDIMNVSGIGESKFNSIKDLICVWNYTWFSVPFYVIIV